MANDGKSTPRQMRKNYSSIKLELVCTPRMNGNPHSKIAAEKSKTEKV